MVELPPSMTRASLNTCLHVVSSIATCDLDVVQIDASRLQFIDPIGLTMLAAACERIGQSDRVVEVVALNPLHGGYLARMDLFRQPWVRCAVPYEGGPRQDARARLVELKLLKSQREVDPAANALASALLGWVPGLSEKAPLDEMSGYNDWSRAHEPLCHTFAELLQNAVTHSRRAGFARANVWVTAQYLGRYDRIQIGIVDTGCGFLGSLRGHEKLKSDTDEAAILLALQPRISCNRALGIYQDAENAGIGLTTVYRIVREVAGRMWIVSGDGVVRVEGNQEANPAGQVGKRWQGVAISVELRREALMRIRFRDLMPPRDFGRPAPALRFEK